MSATGRVQPFTTVYEQVKSGALARDKPPRERIRTLLRIIYAYVFISLVILLIVT
jgi:hypothetical protein